MTVRAQLLGRLQFHALAYNLGNFLRTLATPEPIKDWPVTDKLEGQADDDRRKVASPGRYVVFQNGRGRYPRQMFRAIWRLIAELRSQPLPALV
jgi:hypothetical protein